MSAAHLHDAGERVADDPVGFTRGIMAAVEMMERMYGNGEQDVHAVASRWRRSTPQVNSVRDALDRLLARGSRAELEGFCAVLTEIVADSNSNGQWETEFRAYAERRRRAQVRRSLPRRARAAVLPA